MKDARIGDLAFNRADRTLWGIRHLNGIVLARAHRAALQGVDARPLVPLRHRRLRPRRLAGRHARVGVVRRDRRQAGRPRVLDREAARRRRHAGARSSTSGRRCPSGFVFTRDGKALVGSSYYTGVSNIFRYDIADGGGLGAEQRRDRLLPSGAAARGRRPVRVPLLRRGIRADADRGAGRSRTSARSRSSASGWSRRTRC